MTPSIPSEIERAKSRRADLSIRRPPGHELTQWALCLSGGGIRSATFCLGVLQGLARLPPPPGAPTFAAQGPPAVPANTLPPTPKVVPHPSLLAQFDYLSTVSGGGYVGSFFSSLFVEGRLSGKEAEGVDEAAARAYQALLDEPPERMRARTIYDPDRPGKAALAWLRDNGRYLAPTGSGDMVYAAAVGIRNWFAMHYVLATLLLLVLSLSVLARVAGALIPGYDNVDLILNPEVRRGIQWSATWLAVLAVVLFWVVPFGIGFWFTHPPASKDVSDPPRILTSAFVIAILLALASSGFAWWGCGNGRLGGNAPLVAAKCVLGSQDGDGSSPVWSRALLTVGVFTILGIIALVVTWLVARPKSITAFRVVMTRVLSAALRFGFMLTALGVVETIAQTLMWQRGLITLSAVGAVLVSVTRFVAKRMGEKSAAPVLSKIPWDVFAGIAAVGLWLALAVVLDMLVIWIVGGSATPTLFRSASAGEVLLRSALTCVALFVFALATGHFRGFLNLSTLQGLYSARLTRTYLGASNHTRFAVAGSKWHSVTEPAPNDNLQVETLHESSCAPVHYINVCVNQNVDPGAQLVQRDRKGKPLVVAPNGFYLDGDPHPFPDAQSPKSAELDSALTVGEWIGVSGAAFTTGLGRSTTLGGSLLLGFANVRLGRWWGTGAGSAVQLKAQWLRSLFTTQIYLLDEIRALFHGTRLPYQYLSDGGHFENTAAYEMLRPNREIALLVVCDCGADPDYQFGDLANLIRLARIDLRVEISVNEGAAKDQVLGTRFAVPEHFKRDADGKLPAPDGRCAILLDVCAADAPVGRPHAPFARIVLLKPVMLASAAVDVRNYNVEHSAFPQEPTSDQFFNEAQWESYRKLGLDIAQRVFPTGGDGAYAQKFWETVLT